MTGKRLYRFVGSFLRFLAFYDSIFERRECVVGVETDKAILGKEIGFLPSLLK